MNMPEKTCPDCGSPMKVRTARRGRNAGGRFYGCTRYPACKGTQDYEDESEDSPEPGGTSESADTPRQLRASERLAGNEVRFFQSVSITRAAHVLLINEADPSAIQSFSQWRLDAPATGSTPRDPRVNGVLAVLDKIFSRSKITWSTRRVEQILGDRLELPDEYATGAVREETLVTDACVSSPYTRFDSDEERLFYENVLEPTLGKHTPVWCLPQVELNSLCKGSDVPAGRVDFLVHAPGCSPLVVEIDGKQHEDQQESDGKRDEALEESTYEVLRISAEEVRSHPERAAETLSQYLRDRTIASDTEAVLTVEEKSVHLARIAHQFQVAVLEAACRGTIDLGDPGAWSVSVTIDCPELDDGTLTSEILSGALDDLVDMARHACLLYDAPWKEGAPQLAASDPDCKLRICFGGSHDGNAFHIQNISVPFQIAHESRTLASIPQVHDNEEALTFFLREIFRKDMFLEGQLDGIRRAMSGQDALILLPTGAGKSLIFQLAGLLLPGVSVVVSPLVALMEDQLANLRENGIDRCASISSRIRSVTQREQIQSIFGQGQYLICYVAPERFQITGFRNALRSLTTHTPVNLVAIDEAHCVSEWGHDFRPAYLNIARTAREYCETGGRAPAVIGLTGTASRSVLKDVQRELDIHDYEAIITPTSFDRKELSFHVIASRSEEKQSVLEGLLGRYLPSQFGASTASFFQPRGGQTSSGIIFCPYVGSSFGVVEVADAVRQTLSLSAEAYASGAPKNSDAQRWAQRIRRAADNFRRNRVPLLVATKAFGMGIDKPNIRYTIHYCIPPSIESFYQEAGS